jgi:hypothetical protein
MPKGEQALHLQFLALAWEEIARRQKRPYTEQLEIILNGLLQTISKTVWGVYQGKILLQRRWLKTLRLHLIEQFMLARFVII